MSLATRRRAIYTGLSCHFAGDELLAAVALWESKYAGKPSFALNAFIVELLASTERRIERARVYRDLVSALTGPVTDLLPDPEGQISAWQQRGQEGRSAQAPHDDARCTFEALAARLFSAMDAGLVTRLRGFVVGNLSVLTGSNEQRMLVRNWLEQSLSLEGGLLSPSQLRQLLNLLYVGMCEYLGPVEADQRLSQAVQQCESADLAFAPGKLL